MFHFLRLGCLGPVTSSWRFKFPGWPDPIFRCCGKLLPTISSAWTMARPRHPVRTIWSTIPAEYPINSPTIRSRPCLLVRVPGCSSGNGVCVTACVLFCLVFCLMRLLWSISIASNTRGWSCSHMAFTSSTISRCWIQHAQ